MCACLVSGYCARNELIPTQWSHIKHAVIPSAYSLEHATRVLPEVRPRPRPSDRPTDGGARRPGDVKRIKRFLFGTEQS